MGENGASGGTCAQTCASTCWCRARCSRRNARTHPGEAKPKLPPADSVVPAFLYWLGPQSRGQSGQIIELNPQR